MATYQGKKIRNTYQAVLKVDDNEQLEASLQEITDGAGNGSGVSLNTQGDLSAEGTVSFGSLKDTTEDITITKFVDQADGIASNDNDTSIPTSAAVKDYVDSNVTAQDLDIAGDTGTGAVDLDSQVFTVQGAGTVSTFVSGQTVTITGAGTDLSNTPGASDVVVESSDGNNTTLAGATTSLAGVMASADKTKLDGIETGAEVNPTASEIKTLYESNADTNAFTDAQLSKLNGIESGAEVNPTASEIKTLYESNADTNAFTNADQTKLGTIESGAQVNVVTSVNTQIGTVVLDADDISDSTTTNKFTNASDISKLAGIESGAQVNTVDSVNSQTGTVVLDTDDITEAGNLYYTDVRANSAIDTRVTKSFVENLDINIDADKVVFVPSGEWDTEIVDVQTALDSLQINKVNVSDIPSNVIVFPTDAASDIATYFKLVTSTSDPDYDTTAVDINTGDITGSNQFIAALASEAGIIEGSTGLINVTVVGNVRRISGSSTATFYFEIYKRSGAGVETLIATSLNTTEVEQAVYEEFFASAIITDATFTSTDRLVLKFYGNKVGAGSDSEFQFQFGGTSPVRGLLPVPFNAVPVDHNASEVIVTSSGFDGVLSTADDTAQKAFQTIDDMVLSSINDVSSTSPNNGEVLTYNSTSGEWEPAAVGSAPVDSVNGQTGVVVLDADDIDDTSTTNKFVTSTEVTKLGNITVTQAVDLDTIESDLSGVKGKTDFITVTQNVNLDTIESDTATNNAKISFDSASSSKLAGIETGAQVNTVDSVNGAGGAVVLDADDIDDTTTTNKFTSQAEIDKLAGIEAGADVTDATNVANSGAVMTDTAGSLSSLAVSGNLTVDTNTLYVDAANNNVGIGTTSPSAKLNTNLAVDGSILAYLAGTSFTFDGDANIAVTHNSSTMGTGTAAGLLLANNDNSNNAISPVIAFSAKSASTSFNHTYAAIYGQKRASGADSNWNTGDLIFATGNVTGPVERLRVLAAGGLTFNGDTAAANALDDYEEGTFTCGVAFGGASVGVTYSWGAGTYTKIGRQVTARGYIVLTNKGSSSGNAQITGLPFTNLSGSYSAVSFAEIANISFADIIHGYTQSGVTTIILEETTNAGVFSRLTDANFANNSGFMFTVTYIV